MSCVLKMSLRPKKCPPKSPPFWALAPVPHVQIIGPNTQHQNRLLNTIPMMYHMPGLVEIKMHIQLYT